MDRHIIIASRTTQRLRVRGSTVLPCADCGWHVWVSPSSQRLLSTEPEYMVICTVCGHRRVSADPHPVFRDIDRSVDKVVE